MASGILITFLCFTCISRAFFIAIIVGGYRSGTRKNREDIRSVLKGDIRAVIIGSFIITFIIFLLIYLGKHLFLMGAL
jgi:hypothetical protein